MTYIYNSTSFSSAVENEHTKTYYLRHVNKQSRILYFWILKEFFMSFTNVELLGCVCLKKITSKYNISSVQ